MNGPAAKKIMEQPIGLSISSPLEPAKPVVVSRGVHAGMEKDNGPGRGDKKGLCLRRLKLAGELIAFVLGAAALAVAMMSANSPSLFSGLL